VLLDTTLVIKIKQKSCHFDATLVLKIELKS